jgi:AhpD family alkylhydroperoxidase
MGERNGGDRVRRERWRELERCGRLGMDRSRAVGGSPAGEPQRAAGAGFRTTGHDGVSHCGFARRYERVVDLVLGGFAAMRALRHLHRIPPDLRERLMLVVTGVNRCRYCAAAHGVLARRAGLAATEVEDLIGGRVDAAPAEQLFALRFARSWAEHGGYAGEPAFRELERHYGGDTALGITSALHVIETGNLAGNTWDHLVRKRRCHRTAE